MLNDSIVANTGGGKDSEATGVEGEGISISFSLIADGSCGIRNGENNLSGDPRLGADLCPQAAESPVVDSGSNALVPSDITPDLRGVDRI